MQHKHKKCIAQFEQLSFTCPFTDEPMTALKIMSMSEGYGRVAEFTCLVGSISGRGMNLRPETRRSLLAPVWVEGRLKRTNNWDEITSFPTVQHAIEWVHEQDFYVDR